MCRLRVRIGASILAKIDEDLKSFLPYAKWQRVDVTCPSSANTDFIVRHQLRVEDPENIEYAIKYKDRAVDIYQDMSITRRAWGDGFIVLRATVANAKVTLLLTVPNV